MYSLVFRNTVLICSNPLEIIDDMLSSIHENVIYPLEASPCDEIVNFKIEYNSFWLLKTN